MSRVHRSLSKTGQVKQTRKPRGPRLSARDSLLISQIIGLVRERGPLKLWELADELFGFTNIEERTAHADRLERLVSISPRLQFVDIFDAVHPKLRIFHVALRPEETVVDALDDDRFARQPELFQT